MSEHYLFTGHVGGRGHAHGYLMVSNTARLLEAREMFLDAVDQRDQVISEELGIGRDPMAMVVLETKLDRSVEVVREIFARQGEEMARRLPREGDSGDFFAVIFLPELDPDDNRLMDLH